MDGMVNEFYEPVECSALEPDEKEQMVSRAILFRVNICRGRNICGAILQT